jgi:enterobacterial common antigen flippase
MSDSDSNSYGQILKSSSIMGSVAVVTLILGMIRTKFAAVLIGTTGVGLTASFTAIQGFIGAIAGLGIQSSAVREVAAAYAKADEQAVGETVLTLRRICWLTGLLGALSMLLLSPLLSQLTFSSYEYQWDIAALGLIILFANLSGGQTALLQGARRIADMAKAQVVGAVAGTAITVGFYFWLGLRGIIPALVLMAAVQLMISWHFAKRLPVPKVEMTWRQSFDKAGAMVKLGLVMMWTGLMGSAVTYATAALITQEINVQAVGIYSAAFALSGMFVNFVLNAMGADYYPRLTAAADDHAKVNRLVNEQTEIGLLLALPGLLATMVLAPWIVQLFYTKEFLPAVELIQWFILGCLGRVISWPLGFVLIAGKRTKTYFQLELTWNALHITLIALGIYLLGITGVAIAFFILYIIVTIQCLFVIRSITGLAWSGPARNLVLRTVTLVGLAFVACHLPQNFALTAALFVLVLLTGLISVRGLACRLSSEHLFVRKLSALPGGSLLLGKTFN